MGELHLLQANEETVLLSTLMMEREVREGLHEAFPKLKRRERVTVPGSRIGEAFVLMISNERELSQWDQSLSKEASPVGESRAQNRACACAWTHSYVCGV